MNTGVGALAPPPYNSREEELYLIDRLVNAANRNGRIDNASEPTDAEVGRGRNFIQYVLASDYQCHMNLSLSSVDRTHFAQIYTAICDLSVARHGTGTFPTPDERRQLVPYFWRYLHRPCTVLNVPTEYVVVLMERFTKYQTDWGRYKGCCFGILHDSGTAVLAAKLSMDREVIIPRITEGDVRERMLRAVQEIEVLYFDQVDGIEGFVSSCDTGRQFFSRQTIQYKANERGEAYERNQEKARVSASLPLSICHWATRVQGVMGEILRRHRQVRDGKRKEDPTFSWKGHGDPVPPGPVSRHKAHFPYGWWRRASQHVPDHFEHRPQTGSDL